jgi:DNA-binding LacI/PurR family transcriptional regulator
MRLGSQRHDGPASVGRQEESSYPVQRERIGGLRDALTEVGVDWSTVPVVERFEHSPEAGATAAAELLAAHPDVTALVCTSDVLAIGALQHAVVAGVDVPGSLTITGFDGVPEADRLGLTTVRQPVRRKGQVAGELLLQRGERNTPKQVLLPTELVVGATSGPAKKRQEFFSGW